MGAIFMKNGSTNQNDIEELNIDEFNFDEFEKEMEEFNREWEEFNRKWEEFNREWEEQEKELDKCFEFMDILEKMPDVSKQFEQNINQIRPLIYITSSEHKFLCGTLLVGLISAYEGLVQDLLNLLAQSSHFDKQSLYDKFKKIDGFSNDKSINPDNLFEKLSTKTLNNPFKTLMLLNNLFELDLVQDNTAFQTFGEKSKNLIEIRNDLVHHAGKKRSHEISIEYLKIVSYQLFMLYKIYSIAIPKKLEAILEATTEKLVNDLPQD